MLHSKIFVSSKRTIEGNGLFTGSLIKKGTLVWTQDEPVYPLAEIQQWPTQKQDAFQHYGFQCGVDQFCLSENTSREMNHSCDPNTWWSDSYSLEARRDIQPNEEVTYDYATSDVALAFEISCSCGAENCRGIVTNLDYQLSSWQQQYGTKLPQHTLLAIAESKTGQV